MTYVEWLRVGRCLKCLAIVLLVLLLFAAIARVWVAAHSSNDSTWWMQMGHGTVSRLSTTTLPDGVKRTVYENRKNGTRIVVDDRGYFGKTITVYETHPSKHDHIGSMGFGPLYVTSVRKGSQDITTFQTDAPEPFGEDAAFAALVAMLVATILGAPFGREGEGHLEVALTKPISRERFALATLGVDAIGLLASWAMAVAFLVCVHAIFQVPNMAFAISDALLTGLAFLSIAAWYAMLTAATASLKRGYGLVLGLSWPIALVVALLGRANLGDSPIGQLVHFVAKPLSWIDPITYTNLTPAFEAIRTHPAVLVAATRDALPLFLLVLVYVVLAVFQWRRLEA